MIRFPWTKEKGTEKELLDDFPYPVATDAEEVATPAVQHSYDEIAKKLGFEPAELIRAQLLAFFKDEGIKLFPYEDVNQWMIKKRKEAGADLWCWRPLRPKDVITEYLWGTTDRGKYEDGFYDKGHWECRPYGRLVPQNILEMVAKIEKVFGDKVKFFVCDYASADPDPFIMVRPAVCDDGTDEDDPYKLVFGAWDEPGFES